MDDARRFLRYVLPGLVFTIELALLFILWRPTEAYNVACNLAKADAKESILALALSALVASGGIGFLLSNIHHFLWNTLYPQLSRWTWWLWAVDHREMLERVSEEVAGGDCRGRLLILKKQEDNSVVKARELSRAGAWRVFSALWESRTVAKNSPVKGADRSCRWLCDIAHGAGANLVGIVLAGVIWLATACSSWYQAGFSGSLDYCAVFSVVALIFLILVQCCNYVVAVGHQQAVPQIVMWEVLREEPAVVSVSQDDLEEKN